MIWENWQLVTDEAVEFEKEPVEVHQDFRRITDHFRGILWNIPQINIEKKTDGLLTCNRSDLETLGSQLIMPKFLPDEW
jgi:hypothetical protein